MMSRFMWLNKLNRCILPEKPEQFCMGRCVSSNALFLKSRYRQKCRGSKCAKNFITHDRIITGWLNATAPGRSIEYREMVGGRRVTSPPYGTQKQHDVCWEKYHQSALTFCYSHNVYRPIWKEKCWYDVHGCGRRCLVCKQLSKVQESLSVLKNTI